jgi:hypothetical protein
MLPGNRVCGRSLEGSLVAGSVPEFSARAAGKRRVVGSSPDIMIPPIRCLPRVALLTGLTVPAHAQNVVLTGSLSGRATNPSGAMVLGAQVMVRNLTTGVQQFATTNHDGLYHFSGVMLRAVPLWPVSKVSRMFRLVRVLVGRVLICGS